MFSSVTSSHFRRICAHFTATWRSWRSLGGPRRAERESPEFIAIDQHQYDFKMVFVLTPQISPEQNSSSQMATLQKRRRRGPGAWRRHRIPAAPHHSSPHFSLKSCLLLRFYESVFFLFATELLHAAQIHSHAALEDAPFTGSNLSRKSQLRNNKSCRGGGKLQGWLRLL